MVVQGTSVALVAEVKLAGMRIWPDIAYRGRARLLPASPAFICINMRPALAVVSMRLSIIAEVAETTSC